MKVIKAPQKRRHPYHPLPKATRLSKAVGKPKGKHYLQHQGKGNAKLEAIMGKGVHGTTSGSFKGMARTKKLSTKVREKQSRIRASKWRHGIKAGDSMRWNAPKG